MATEQQAGYRHNWPTTRPIPMTIPDDPSHPDYWPSLEDFAAASVRLWRLSYDWSDGIASRTSYYTTPAGEDRRFGVGQGEYPPLTFANWNSFLSWLSSGEAYWEVINYVGDDYVEGY